MKIAILSRYQGMVNRGAESVVYELSKRLSKRHQVDIYSGKDSDNISLMLKNHYDIVIPMNGRWQSLKASLGRLTGGYRLIITGQSGIGRDDIWNIALCKPDVFVALTDLMFSWAKKWAWGSKVVKIPSGVDSTKFKTVGEKYSIDLPHPIVLSVGALTWYKHHERTIEAVGLLKNASLLIVGDGEERENLERLGNEKLKGRFKMVKVRYEEIPEIYRSVDVFTLPSWDREAFGVVYLEAMASGLPVVAPNDAPRREIVGNAGILTDVTDKKKFADSLNKALNKKWGNLPRKQAEKFSWDKIASEYELLFEKL